MARKERSGFAFSEDHRQLILLALAYLHLERTDLGGECERIAKNLQGERLYLEYKRIRALEKRR